MHDLTPQQVDRQKRVRRTHSKAFKARLVAMAEADGASVAQIAMDNKINANQLRRWMKESYSRSESQTLLPVSVAFDTSISSSFQPGIDNSCHGIECLQFHHQNTSCMGSTGRGHIDKSASMITPPARASIWLPAGVTDMRKGMPRLAALVRTSMDKEPLSGHVFVFRGRRGDLIKVLWFSGDGTNLYIKRLERGRFIWPSASEGRAQLSSAQFSMLCEAIDWRAPERTWWPTIKSA